MADKRYPDSPAGPASFGFAVVPHDTNELASIPRALFVGTAGNLTVNFADSDTDVVLLNVAAGQVLNIQVRRVKTATTAANIVALV